MSKLSHPALLNPRQLLFVEQYLIDLNGKEAAIRAGYSSTRAAARGYALLQRPEIRAAIAAAMAWRAARTEITPERVLEEYARIAFSDWRHFADWGPKGARFADARDLSPEDTPAIAELVDAGPRRGGDESRAYSRAWRHGTVRWYIAGGCTVDRRCTTAERAPAAFRRRISHRLQRLCRGAPCRL
jgi:phage terminase small subunit